MNIHKTFIVSIASILTQTVFAEPLPTASESLKTIFEQKAISSEAQKGNSYADTYHSVIDTAQQPENQKTAYWSNQLKTYLNASDLEGEAWSYQRAIMGAFIYTTPSPENWDELAKQVSSIELENKDETKEKALQLFSMLLTGNQSDFKKLLYAESDQPSNDKGLISKMLGRHGGRTQDKFRSLKNSYSSSYSNLEELMAEFDKQLSEAERIAKNPDNSYAYINVPELAKWLPKDQADVYYKRILPFMVSEDGPSKRQSISLSLTGDHETLSQLAKELEKTEGKLSFYPSQMISSLRDRALLQRVSGIVDQLEPYDRKGIQKINFDFSVCDGDVEKATQILKAAHDEIAELKKQDLSKLETYEAERLSDLIESGPDLSVNPENLEERKVAFEVLMQLVEQPGGEFIWNELNSLGLKLGESDRVLELFSQAYPVDQPIEMKDTGSVITIANTYLAFDDLESARLLRNKVTEILENAFNEVLAMEEGDEKEAALADFPLGNLLGHYRSEAYLAEALGEEIKAKEWHLKTVQSIQNISLDQITGGKNIYENINSSIQSSAGDLAEMGNYIVAHETLIELLRLSEHFKYLEEQKQKSSGRYYYGDRYSASKYLSQRLISLYRHTGQPEEVIWLLKNSPYWSEDDLYKLNDDLLLDAAWAFNKIGDKEMAYNILSTSLLKGALLNSDPAYKQLLALKDSRTDALLDELIKFNPYQERPLIWKAQMALDRGDFPTAETLARKGIAIDPSDGEQGRDDRMQVYAVLSKALAGLGNQKDADFFNEVVEAIRMGERADSLYSAGLIKRALGKYNESLGRFADAYCLQSRLAIYYADLGEMDKAEAHYQRAFELMPSSFGRIESHCFGCEGAFRSDTAQTIAGRVFTKAIADNPEHPQNYYLMGYLEESRDQPDKAIGYYQKAVDLDPEYVNAWKKLSSLDAIPTDENLAIKVKAKLAHIKLQPHSYKGRRLEGLSFQIPEVYGILSNAEAPKINDSLTYPLIAAKIRLAAVKERQAQQQTQKTDSALKDFATLDRKMRNDKTIKSMVSNDNLIQQLMQLILQRSN